MGKEVGILCPVSALPSCYGIGDFGENAYLFVDKLASSSLALWQILPLNPLGYGNSPYQPLSSQAGDDIYVSIDGLIKDGLLKKEEIDFDYSDLEYVDYQNVRKQKEKLFHKAFSRFNDRTCLYTFMNENMWVKDYATYRVFKSMNDEKSWVEWKYPFKKYLQNPSLSLVYLSQQMLYQVFLQYYFYKQWKQLKAYANQKGIQIIGDMPIYVGLDSVDVWTHQECFLLNEDGRPSCVAGVPPDYFSQYGQRWGNPLYNWTYLKENDFSFWVERMQAASYIYDRVRIDHFRGFDTYWMIPASEPTAIIGKWQEAPGYELFDTLFKKIPHLSVLAEDLGELRDEVYTLRDHYHLKGMYVFQFHYNCDYDFEKVIVYTGTHDNDTLVGWLKTLDEKQKKDVYSYLDENLAYDDYWKVIQYCLKLPTNQVIIPIWDILGLDSTHRFNQPGIIGSPNWEMRMISFVDFEKQMKIYQSIQREVIS